MKASCAMALTPSFKLSNEPLRRMRWLSLARVFASAVRMDDRWQQASESRARLLSPDEIQRRSPSKKARFAPDTPSRQADPSASPRASSMASSEYKDAPETPRNRSHQHEHADCFDVSASKYGYDENSTILILFRCCPALSPTWPPTP